MINRTAADDGWLAALIGELIDEGYRQDEIAEEVVRYTKWDTRHDLRLIEEEVARVWATRGGKHRRARGLPDPRGSFDAAIAELREKDVILSRQAVAVEMHIDRGTLQGYIDDGLVPAPPWEGLPRTPRGR